MRSHGNQLVIFDDDPRIRAAREARAWRAAAAQALAQYEFIEAVRLERHRYYLDGAMKIEAEFQIGPPAQECP